MDYFERLEESANLDYVINHLLYERTNFNENGKGHIRDVKNLFEGISEDLELLLNGEPLTGRKDLIEISESIYGKTLPKEKRARENYIKKVRNKIGEFSMQLEDLSENRGGNSTDNYNNLLTVCLRLRNEVYSDSIPLDL